MSPAVQGKKILLWMLMTIAAIGLFLGMIGACLSALENAKLPKDLPPVNVGQHERKIPLDLPDQQHHLLTPVFTD